MAYNKLMAMVIIWFACFGKASAQSNYGEIFDNLSDKQGQIQTYEFNDLERELLPENITQQSCDRLYELLMAGDSNATRFILEYERKNKEGAYTRKMCRIKREVAKSICRYSSTLPEIYGDKRLMYSAYLFSRKYHQPCYEYSFYKVLSLEGRSSFTNGYAINFLEAAADLENEQAELILGNTYAMTKGVICHMGGCEKSKEIGAEDRYKKGFVYLNKSAERGSSTAMQLLKKYYNYDFLPSKADIVTDGTVKTDRPTSTLQVVASNNSYNKPYNAKPNIKTDQRLSQPSAQVSRKKSPDLNLTRYVNATSLNIRAMPSGQAKVLGKIWRAEFVRILETSNGWGRMKTAGGDVGWVSLKYLSESQPSPIVKSAPKPSASSRQSSKFGYRNKYELKYYDSRVEYNAISDIGSDGLTEFDVETLWMGASKALNGGWCKVIKDASFSSSKAGQYWLNCGRRKNLFFVRRGNQIGFR